jgi:tRNA/rRNA methyltransferase
MSGTDKTKSDKTRAGQTETGVTGGPAVILVDPQLGENIGMVARAMLNCGLTDLRLVRPRDGWPNAKADSAASGAGEVLAAARVFQSTGEAIAGLQRLYATSARPRGLVKRLTAPREAAGEMREAASRGEAVGVLFGPERAGLINDDLALADAVLAIPLNPAFCSLNLAQAVLLVGYEWYLAAGEAGEAASGGLETGGARLADKAELINFFERLERALDETGFLFPPEKRPGMVRNLRSLFGRMALTEPEVNTLHGIVSALRTGRKGGPEGEG